MEKNNLKMCSLCFVVDSSHYLLISIDLFVLNYCTSCLAVVQSLHILCRGLLPPLSM